MTPIERWILTHPPISKRDSVGADPEVNFLQIVRLVAIVLGLCLYWEWFFKNIWNLRRENYSQVE